MSGSRIVGYGLNSGDLERAVEFYTEVFGFHATKAEAAPFPEWVLQHDEGPEVHLMLVDAHADSEVARGWGRGVLVVEDAAELCRQVRARGLPVLRDALPVAGHPVIVALVEDPDGNRIEVVQYEST
jgi:lactoylglutathione lyase